MSSLRYDDIVREQFRARAPDAPPRVGIEAEFICMHREGPHPAAPLCDVGSPVPGTVAIVTELARAEGWARSEGPGLPRFCRPDGTTISWEPGGQIECATAPLTSLDAADVAIRTATSKVGGALEPHGIGLLARGLDPWTPVGRPRLWLHHPRYVRMARHYDRGGVHGRRMMRQTAGVHVNLDLGASPLVRWERVNAAIPALIAIFANASRIEGAEGWRSERSRAWRGLDPTRTGVFGPSEDPVADYIRFARAACAFLVGPEDTSARPWAHRDGSLGEDAWRQHLSTLFPEVRPRRYLEIRSVDALPPELVTVAAAFLAGIVYGTAPIPEVGPPMRARLEQAGRDGLSDLALRHEALAWWVCAESGLDQLGPGFASAELRERVTRFRDAFTACGRDPGAVEQDWV